MARLRIFSTAACHAAHDHPKIFADFLAPRMITEEEPPFIG